MSKTQYIPMSDEDIISEATANYADDDIQIDSLIIDHAIDGSGAWVRAWLWVGFEEKEND